MAATRVSPAEKRMKPRDKTPAEHARGMARSRGLRGGAVPKKQKEEKRLSSRVGERALDEGYRPGTRAFSAYIASGGNKRAIREETSGRGGRGYFGRKPKRDSTR